MVPISYVISVPVCYLGIIWITKEVNCDAIILSITSQGNDSERYITGLMQFIANNLASQIIFPHTHCLHLQPILHT